MVEPTTGAETLMLNQDTTIITAPEGTGPQLIQIGQGDDQQFIEVPEGYSLIQTPEGLVMSQVNTPYLMSCNILRVLVFWSLNLCRERWKEINY